jgi:hypothetical protein
LRDREIYYDARRDDGLATAEWREPTRSDRLPVHRSESPTGYASAGCSPAEPASASPVTANISAIPIRCVAVLQCRAGRVRRQGGVISILHAGCHFYLAPTSCVAVTCECQCRPWSRANRPRRRSASTKPFDKVRQVDQAAIADNQAVGADTGNEFAMNGCAAGRAKYWAPRRRDQRDGSLFKVG